MSFIPLSHAHTHTHTHTHTHPVQHLQFYQPPEFMLNHGSPYQQLKKNPFLAMKMINTKHELE